MAGIPSPTEAVRSALKIILGTVCTCMFCHLPASQFRFDDVFRIRRNEVFVVI